jgi:hypothetical protein
MLLEYFSVYLLDICNNNAAFKNKINFNDMHPY